MSEITSRAVKLEANVRPDNSLIYVGGVCIGRLVTMDGELLLEVKDRNGRRSRELGRDFVMIPLSSLVSSLEQARGTAVSLDASRR